MSTTYKGVVVFLLGVSLALGVVALMKPAPKVAAPPTLQQLAADNTLDQNSALVTAATYANSTKGLAAVELRFVSGKSQKPSYSVALPGLVVSSSYVVFSVTRVDGIVQALSQQGLVLSQVVLHNLDGSGVEVLKPANASLGKKLYLEQKLYVMKRPKNTSVTVAPAVLGMNPPVRSGDLLITTGIWSSLSTVKSFTVTSGSTFATATLTNHGNVGGRGTTNAGDLVFAVKDGKAVFVGIVQQDDDSFFSAVSAQTLEKYFPARDTARTSKS